MHDEPTNQSRRTTPAAPDTTNASAPGRWANDRELGGLVRPGLPLPFGDRVREMLDDRGLTVGRVLATAVVGGALLVLGWWLLRPPAPPIEASLPIETTHARLSPGAAPAGETAGVAATTTTLSTELVVHAAGAVARPGLYKMHAGTRVADLIAAAGGMTPDADAGRVNLAAPLRDGERVYVLHAGEATVPVAVGGDVPSSGAAGETAPATPAGPVDLNSATAEELDTLPGVGPSTAAAIIAYRTEHGSFASVDELLEVRGIGDAKLAELRNRVRV